LAGYFASSKDHHPRFADTVWKMALIEGFPKSRYEQLKALLSATPAQLSPFQSRPKFARTLVLLKQKGIYFEHDPFKPEIFSFERPNLRGFEVVGLSPVGIIPKILKRRPCLFSTQKTDCLCLEFEEP
jgi:hypothetical protein